MKWCINPMKVRINYKGNGKVWMIVSITFKK